MVIVIAILIVIEVVVVIIVMSVLYLLAATWSLQHPLRWLRRGCAVDRRNVQWSEYPNEEVFNPKYHYGFRDLIPSIVGGVLGDFGAPWREAALAGPHSAGAQTPRGLEDHIDGVWNVVYTVY